MNLVHAQPSVSCAAVSHDAVVARHSERHPAREAVSVNDCNGWDYREHAVSNEGHGSTLLNALTRKCHEPEQHGVEHDYASKISISGGAAQSEVCQYARGKKFVRKVGSLVAFAKSRPGRTREVASVRAIHDSNHLTRRLTIAEELVLAPVADENQRAPAVFSCKSIRLFTTPALSSTPRLSPFRFYDIKCRLESTVDEGVR